MGVAVIGNMFSGKFSLNAFWFGIIGAFVFLIFGYLLDKMEIN